MSQLCRNMSQTCMTQSQEIKFLFKMVTRVIFVGEWVGPWRFHFMGASSLAALLKGPEGGQEVSRRWPGGGQEVDRRWPGRTNT